ncbi:MAG TPA: cupredoxin family copper-binding protein [Nocardioides sp.]|nr:cupredoxin family copper-binding protein [Nocardioides sp.]
MSHPSPARTPSPRVRAALLVASLLAPLLGALGLAAGPASAAQHAITIKQYMFMPGSMSIRQGDTITWTNQDTVGHDVEVTSGPASFHSPMLAKGQSWSFTFSAAGTYSYICSVHPDMKATVTVAAAPVQQAPQHAAQHQTAAGTTTTTRTSATTRHAAQRTKASTRKPAAATTAPATTTPASTVVTPGTDAALDPLLLVAGVAVAVVVFCLLLLTSRPERPLLAPAHRGVEADETPMEETRVLDPVTR